MIFVDSTGSKVSTSGSGISPYDVALAYATDDIVLYNDRLYAANGAIVANTAFELGTTGATWRVVGSDSRFFPAFSLDETYKDGDIILANNALYEVNTATPITNIEFGDGLLSGVYQKVGGYSTLQPIADVAFEPAVADILQTDGYRFTATGTARSYVTIPSPTSHSSSYRLTLTNSPDSLFAIDVTFNTTSKAFIGIGEVIVMEWVSNKWVLVYESTRIVPYVATRDYGLGTVVIKDGSLYYANALVPANTVFALGTTGTTWKQLGGSGAGFSSVVAATTIASGDVVRFSGGQAWPDGYTSEASTTATGYGLNGIQINAFASVYVPSNQIVSFFAGTVAGALFYTVGTISGAGVDATVTWTASAQLTTTATSNLYAAYDAVADKVVIAYTDSAGKLAGFVLTRSGIVWTAGAVNTLAPTANVSAFTLDSDVGILSGWNGSNTAIYVLAISGTTITLSSTSTTFISIDSTHIARYTADKYLITTMSSSTLDIRVFTPSTNSFGTTTNLVTGLGQANPGARVFTANDYIYVMYGGDSAVWWRSASINPTTFAITLMNQGLISANSWVGADLVDGNIYVKSLTSGQQLLQTICTPSTGSVTFADPTGLPSYTPMYILDGIGSTIWYTWQNQGAATQKLYYQSIYLDDTVSTYPLLGIAQEAAISSATFKVAIDRQISTVHSGLISGSDYYVDANVLSTTVGGTFIGQALNATDIQVQTIGISTAVGYSSIVDNTIVDPSLITIAGRYIVPATGALDVFIGKENQYADFDGTQFTYSVPVSGTKVTINSGSNAGQVWQYVASAWTLTTQTTGLPVYNYVSSNAYKANDLVIYNQSEYQANGAIPANTAFAVGTTGATWKQIGLLGGAEYGQVLAPTGYGNITAGTNVWQDYFSFTVPSAGTWEITPIVYAVIANNVGMKIAIKRSSGTVVADSASILYSLSSTTGIATNVAQIVTTGAETMTVVIARTTTGTAQAYSTPSEAQSKVSWKKIAGYLPVIGQAANYLEANCGTGVNLTLNAAIVFNTKLAGNIGYSTTTGVITLLAGSTYELTAALGSDGATGSQFMNYQFYDTATATLIGTAGVSESLNNNTSFSNQQVAKLVISPTSTMTITLRCTGSSGTPRMRANYSWLSVRQLGTTNATQFVGMLSNTYNSGNTYPAGTIVVYQSNLYQANATVPSGTAFTLGTTGATWKQVGIAGASEYGESAVVATTVSVTTSSTTPATAVDIISFTVPSAGTWEIEPQMRASTSAVGGVSYALFDSANVLIADTECIAAYSSTATPTIQITGSRVWRVTTTGAATYKVRAWVQTSAGSIMSDTNGRSVVSWKKIAGYLPVLGQAVNYGSYFISSFGTAAGSVFGLTAKTGTLPVVNSTITLPAGGTYLLRADLSLRSTYFTYYWADASGVQFPNGNQGSAASVNSGDASSPAAAVLVLNTTAPTVVKLVTGTLTGVDVSGQGFAFDVQYSNITITQIGSSTLIAPPARTNRLGTDAGGQFIAGSNRVFDWSSIVDGTPTTGGTKTGTLVGNAAFDTASTGVRLTNATRQNGSVVWDLAGIADFSRDMDMTLAVIMNTTADGVSIYCGGNASIANVAYSAAPANGSLQASIATYAPNNYSVMRYGAITSGNSPILRVQTGARILLKLSLRTIGFKRRAILYGDFGVHLDTLDITNWIPSGAFFQIGGQTGGSGDTHYVSHAAIDYV